MSESQESEGSALGEMYRGVSDWEISVTFQSPSSRDTRELEEAEEEESCECALPMESGEMGNSQISELLESISKDPEDLCLSTSHCLAAGFVPQDCATGKFFQDCAPEVLLAADILTSRASQSCF